MSRKIKIAVDVMSGDLGPEAAVKGAGQETMENPTHLLLVGDEKIIKSVLEKTPHKPEQIEILHAPDVITMEDSPKDAVEKKPQSSLVQAVKAAADGKTDAVVSAGNTGALIVCCSKLIPRIEGVRKTALSAVYPTQKATPSGDRFALLLDVGATLINEPEDLMQFALMGKAYASTISKVESPSIGLLNIGTEPHKGGERLVKAHQYFSNHPGLNFYGNVEGCDIPVGVCDVIVCDGFVGNIALKLAEGFQNVMKNVGKAAFQQKLTWMLGIILLGSGLKQLKKATDYSEYGGAPILGYERLCIKAHGKSNAKAIKNAIKVAAKAVYGNVGQKIKDSVQKFNETSSTNS